VTAAARLDPIALAIDAYRRMWRTRDHALRLGLPLLVLGIAWNVWFGEELAALQPLSPDGPPPSPEAMMAMQIAILRPMLAYLLPAMLLYAILAGNVARLLLIGPQATYPLLGLALDRRLLAVVGRFVQAALATVLAIFVISIPLSLLLGLASAGAMLGFGIGLVAIMAVLLAVMAIWLRLSVAAYATAVDRPMRLLEAWRATAGNGLPLLGAYLAVNMPVIAASFVLGALLGAIAHVVPYTSVLLLNLVALVSSLVSVAVVALAVERLTGAPPRSPTIP
jgi:hypothetical protein